jgi:hypothetical protein
VDKKLKCVILIFLSVTFIMSFIIITSLGQKIFHTNESPMDNIPDNITKDWIIAALDNIHTVPLHSLFINEVTKRGVTAGPPLIEAAQDPRGFTHVYTIMTVLLRIDDQNGTHNMCELAISTSNAEIQEAAINHIAHFESFGHLVESIKYLDDKEQINGDMCNMSHVTIAKILEIAKAKQDDEGRVWAAWKLDEYQIEK